MRPVTTTRNCPGPCNLDYRRAQQQYEEQLEAWNRAMDEHAELVAEGATGLPGPPDRPEEPELKPIPGEPVWCGRCHATVRAALASLDDLAAQLTAGIDGHRSAPSGDKVSGSRGAPSPNPASDTLDELYAALVKVENDWREYRGYAHRPDRSRSGAARSITIAWLLDHLDEILTHPASDQFGRAALAWQRRLQKMTKSQPTARRRPGCCPRCDLRALASRDDGYVECSSCGRLMDENEYLDEAGRQSAKRASA